MNLKNRQKAFLIRKISIGKRLNLGMFLVSFVPVFLICLFSYQKTFEESKEKISMYSSEIVTLASKNIIHMIDGLENDSIDIAYNDVLQKTLLEYDMLSEHEIYLREKKLVDICTKKYVYDSLVSDVIALTNRNQSLFCFGDSYFRLSPSQESLKWISSKVNDYRNMVAYFPVNENFEQRIYPRIAFNRGDGFALCRTIKSREANQKLGMLIIRVDESKLKEKFADLNLGDGAKVILINSDARIISSVNSRYHTGETSTELNQEELIRSKTQNGIRDVYYSGEKHLGVYNKIKGTDWILWGLIPYDYINYNSRTLGLTIIGIGSICLFFVFLTASTLVKSFTAPLRKLDTAMEMVVKGNFDSTLVQDTAPDELGDLSRKFVWMTDELNIRTEQIIEKENQKRESEIKALQRQINPHFMSNTLNTIAYLARIQGIENIEKVSIALINLMIASCGKGNGLIPVSQEISYIKDYMYIQEFKYGNVVEVQYDIDQNINGFLVPCFMLQPIIENALVHGIGNMAVGGVIRITGGKKDGRLHFSVIDNGVGMKEEKIQSILEPRIQGKKSHFSGIGIQNVNERIRILFGDKYGLTISSEQNKMTRVDIIIPPVSSEGLC